MRDILICLCVVFFDLEWLSSLHALHGDVSALGRLALLSVHNGDLRLELGKLSLPAIRNFRAWMRLLNICGNGTVAQNSRWRAILFIWTRRHRVAAWRICVYRVACSWVVEVFPYFVITDKLGSKFPSPLVIPDWLYARAMSISSSAVCCWFVKPLKFDWLAA